MVFQSKRADNNHEIALYTKAAAIAEPKLAT
jgi:hypothetical protein